MSRFTIAKRKGGKSAMRVVNKKNLLAFFDFQDADTGLTFRDFKLMSAERTASSLGPPQASRTRMVKDKHATLNIFRQRMTLTRSRIAAKLATTSSRPWPSWRRKSTTSSPTEAVAQTMMTRRRVRRRRKQVQDQCVVRRVRVTPTKRTTICPSSR
jgi:hypothetical protein